MGDWTGVKNIFKTESDYKSTCGAETENTKPSPVARRPPGDLARSPC